MHVTDLHAKKDTTKDKHAEILHSLDRLIVDIYEILSKIYHTQWILYLWGKVINIRGRDYVNIKEIESM